MIFETSVPAEVERLRQAMPPTLRASSLLGYEAWQWAALGIVMLAGIAAASLLRSLAGGALARALEREGHREEAQRLRWAVRPLAHCVAGLLWLRALPLTGLDGVLLSVLEGAARLFALGAAAWLGVRLADFLGDRLTRAGFAIGRTPSRLDDLIGPLVRKTLKVLAVGVAIVYMLRSMGVEVAPLVASLGLGGLAIAFAAKDTIENFFGSVAVIVDRPFEVGDTISVAGIEGQVTEVGFRSTRLLTSRGTLVTLPNATLVRATVERLGDASHQIVGFTLRLDPATAPEQVVELRDGIREAVLAHPRTVDEETDVRLVSVSEGTLEVAVRVVLEAAEKAAEREDRERILLEVLALARRLGVTLSGPKSAAVSAAPKAPQPAPHPIVPEPGASGDAP